MPELEEHYRFRGELTDALRADVLGPVRGENEVLAEGPLTAYITGVLHARHRDRPEERAEVDEEDHDLAPGTLTVDETPDTGVSMANLQKPSAMGLTFSVDPKVGVEVRIEVDAATYESVDGEGNPVAARRAERRGTSEADEPQWRRTPLRFGPVAIDVMATAPGPLDLDGRGLELRFRVREPDRDGIVGVTVSLVNTRLVTGGEVLDPHCYFQPRISVSVPEGAPALVERGGARGADEDEVKVSRLLHRHAPSFATGHGCAAEWDWTAPPPTDRGPRGRAGAASLRTTFVPVRDVLLTDSNPRVAEPSMLHLAEGDPTEVLDGLDRLVGEYEWWIAMRREDAARLESGFAEVAGTQLGSCQEAAARIRRGIARLRADPRALRAFRWANEAMAHQRARTVWIRNDREGNPELAAGRWRPFQIGFILLCLDGIVDEHHDDRRLADLLWFPTGGGKTEAYLGLIAFTTFLRRLRRGTSGGGVTVLMRYTLRLLTLQQFERAAALICGMEVVRRREVSALGEETISIGMWVGRAATPNLLEEAHESLEELRKGKALQERNPVQLRACPWCGGRLDHRDYTVDLAVGTMSICCHAPECVFRSGLPVHVVDEDIYAVRPTLVIATADKFAQMPWRARVAGIFNREGASAGTPPPELVIQDELHLISGPLGSLAGLYETAIDHVSNRPKIIASTATIRRALDQGRQLFDREVRQFPPTGLDARDSWFSVEAPRENRASRQYVGLLAPGTSQATLLIRTFAALLHHVGRLEGDDRVRDSYWTLVGYFNSLRLLSAAELQVHADVAERLRTLQVRDGDDEERRVDVLRELTSRIESSEVPRHLRELFVERPSPEAIDVVLATNMISVGVDVDRLGLMAVMGQPQTTAEYIQATSRVGRRDPGLVVTMLNASRSRDRSHYENFVPFHSALYRQVESTSVTPFAARARDRALHAALVGILRVMHPAARPNDAAGRVEDFLKEVEEASEVIKERVASLVPEDLDAVREELDRFVESWRELAADGPLDYEARPRKWAGALRAPDSALLRAYGKDEDLEYAQETMWSLRDVDVESDLYLER